MSKGSESGATLRRSHQSSEAIWAEHASTIWVAVQRGKAMTGNLSTLCLATSSQTHS